MIIHWPVDWLAADWPDVYNTGVTEPWTQQAVASILRASTKSRVLELGSYLGHTTVWMAQVLEESQTPFPDLTTVELEATRSEETINKLNKLGLRFPWAALAQDSISYLKSCTPHTFDFVWVDDDHTTDHVAEELELLIRPTARELGVVAPGGIILMHDVYGPHALGGVCSRYGGVCLDFPKLGSDGGLGVIQL